MENKIMDEKSKTADIHKIFKELISLHSDKLKDLLSYEYYFQDIEEDIDDEDENDLDYLKTLLVNLVEELKNFLFEKSTTDIKKKSTINNFKK